MSHSFRRHHELLQELDLEHGPALLDFSHFRGVERESVARQALQHEIVAAVPVGGGVLR